MRKEEVEGVKETKEEHLTEQYINNTRPLNIHIRANNNNYLNSMQIILLGCFCLTYCARNQINIYYTYTLWLYCRYCSFT